MKSKLVSLFETLAAGGWVPGEVAGWREDYALLARNYGAIASAQMKGENLALSAVAVELLAREQPDTVRGVMYQVVSAGWLPDTSAVSYGRIQRLLTALRRKRIIPFEWIVDNVRETIKPSSWSGLADFADTVAEAYRKDFWAGLDDYVEVIVEKDTVAGRVEPVTREYDVSLHPLRGYSSVSFAWSIAQRWAEIEKPIFIYYIGDHDPSGRDIERSIQAELKQYSGREFTWERIAVNPADFQTFNIIPLAPKKKDRRYAAFHDEFGDDCAEVEAIPASALRDRLRACIKGHIPADRWARLQEIEAQEKQTWHNMLASMEGGRIVSNGNGQPDGLEVLRKAEAAARARMPQITVADNPNDLLGAMLKYRRQGRSVIPAAGKKPPIDRHGQTMPWRKYQHVPPSESTIRSWLAPGRFPGPITGILLVCGVPLRYEVARDWDKRPPKDEWSESHPDLTHICPTVWTPRGGHVHFRADVGVIEGDDGELKGRGGMVLMPPSLHPDGSRYRWEVPDGELPKLDPKAAGLYPSAQHPIADPSAQHNLKENVAQAFSAVSGVLSVLSVPSVPKCSQDIAAEIASTRHRGGGFGMHSKRHWSETFVYLQVGTRTEGTSADSERGRTSVEEDIQGMAPEVAAVHRHSGLGYELG